ncbi:hypothetical protein NDU88_010239 [Pleurodeles waltl]|uniref:Uncharacterized protein n=1 Tax=Pleurodeles waltl TaxID=8319 RepID=A0AAV7PVC8_PLEWA|nr:hypothetical protein NDU88_010239 [Pleurodeles waltl]
MLNRLPYSCVVLKMPNLVIYSTYLLIWHTTAFCNQISRTSDNNPEPLQRPGTRFTAAFARLCTNLVFRSHMTADHIDAVDMKMRPTLESEASSNFVILRSQFQEMMKSNTNIAPAFSHEVTYCSREIFQYRENWCSALARDHVAWVLDHS